MKRLKFLDSASERYFESDYLSVKAALSDIAQRAKKEDDIGWKDYYQALKLDMPSEGYARRFPMVNKKRRRRRLKILMTPIGEGTPEEVIVINVIDLSMF